MKEKGRWKKEDVRWGEKIDKTLCRCYHPQVL
jgi:hypothetical protein